MIQQLCSVQSCQEVAKNTFLLRIKSPEITASAQPGQFVNILASENGEGPLLRRPFSISRIEDDIIELIFHAIGIGTKLLSRKQLGDWIDVIGPLGQPFHVNAEHDNALLVAGGIGVAPFPFLTNDLLKRGKRIETFVGYRNAAQVFTEHLQNVRVATDDGSNGFHGNVVQLLESSLVQNKYGKVKIFACGPTVMLKVLTDLAQRKNICCEMSLEGQMACGYGICQGCAVERTEGTAIYALVCKDGPAFLSTEVNL
ncbi:MAG: dihydroorotate dehydrogenase electron transfer subunit [Bacteroidota bacterium]|jgi:dihydroorotate dehydrogenase electron transfer subunit